MEAAPEQVFGEQMAVKCYVKKPSLHCLESETIPGYQGQLEDPKVHIRSDVLLPPINKVNRLQMHS